MNPLLPSSIHPPVTRDFDPRAYGVIGEAIPRGHKDFIMSRSELMEFYVNPWKWKNGGKRKATKAMEFGSLVDCLTLTPHRFNDWYMVKPDNYPVSKPAKDGPTEKPWNLNADYCRAWEDAQREEGRTPISRDFLLECRTASANLMADERIASLIACSECQVLLHVEYHDKETGIVVQVKTLNDMIPASDHPEHGRWDADLKSTNDASPDKWERKIYEDRLHIQAALHLDASNAAMSLNKGGFLHAIVEQEPPYAVARRFLSEEFITLGRDKYVDALKLYSRCVSTEKWPGYDDGINDTPSQPICDGWRVAAPSVWMV